MRGLPVPSFADGGHDSSQHEDTTDRRFWAAYLAVTDKRGISALLLQRQLGLTRYETAWMLLHNCGARW